MPGAKFDAMTTNGPRVLVAIPLIDIDAEVAAFVVIGVEAEGRAEVEARRLLPFAGRPLFTEAYRRAARGVSAAEAEREDGRDGRGRRALPVGLFVTFAFWRPVALGILLVDAVRWERISLEL